MLKNTIIFFKGFLMGIAEIIPGVSGSTLALILGIYSQFIDLLYQISNLVKEFCLFVFFKSSLKKLKKTFVKIDIKFAIILFFGMVSAIALFSNIVNYLLEGYQEYVLAFFFGLVLASITIPWGEIKEKGKKEYFIVFLTSIIFFLILSLKPQVFSEAPNLLYFFIGGSLGICAMVLPGVSGSFIFLMLGLYEYIVSFLSNVTKLQFVNSEVYSLFSLALGIFFGFVFFVRFLKYALKNHSNIIFSFLTGIMIASLRVLWVFDELLISLFLVSLIGFLVVFFLKKLKN